MAGPVDLSTLPVTWTAIAWRPCDPTAGWWKPTKDAPITVDNARRLYDHGLLLMATKLDGIRYLLLVKRSGQASGSDGYFTERKDNSVRVHLRRR